MSCISKIGLILVSHIHTHLVLTVGINNNWYIKLFLMFCRKKCGLCSSCIGLWLPRYFLILSTRESSPPTSAKRTIVRKSYLNNSATLNSHTSIFRCSRMLPDNISNGCGLPGFGPGWNRTTGPSPVTGTAKRTKPGIPSWVVTPTEYQPVVFWLGGNQTTVPLYSSWNFGSN